MNFFNFQLMAVFVEILSTMHPCNHFGVFIVCLAVSCLEARKAKAEEAKQAKESPPESSKKRKADAVEKESEAAALAKKKGAAAKARRSKAQQSSSSSSPRTSPADAARADAE